MHTENIDLGARAEYVESLFRQLVARIDRDGGQKQEQDGSLVETLARVDAVIAQLNLEHDELEARQTKGRYRVELDGELTAREFDWFEQAIAEYGRIRERHPRAALIRIINIDGLDVDCSDGLTQEQSDIVGSL